MPKPLFRMSFKTWTINFKEVFTVRTLQIQINPLVTVTQMIEYVRPLLAVKFDINLDDIEIVDSEQYMEGYLAEEAPELVPSNRKIYDFRCENRMHILFYVRRKNFIYPQIERNIREREARLNISNISIKSNSYLGDCPICLESTLITNRYSCIHGVCSTCYNRGKLVSIASVRCCPLCRSV